MKWKTLLADAALLTVVFITPARAMEYNFKAPDAGDFGTPTSYLPESGEVLTPIR